MVKCKNQNIIIGWPALTKKYIIFLAADIVLNEFFTVRFRLIDSRAMTIKYLLTYLRAIKV